MRISDWSSDVCSSDLIEQSFAFRIVTGPADEGTHRLRHIVGHGDRGRSIDGFAVIGAILERGHGLSLRADSRLTLRPDRQSVVEGKSWSVRVDLGGRRLLNKHTN